MAVFDEKLRENSHLKRAYHTMMDLLVAKEAELAKLRGESETRRPRSDSGGVTCFEKRSGTYHASSEPKTLKSVP